MPTFVQRLVAGWLLLLLAIAWPGAATAQTAAHTVAKAAGPQPFGLVVGQSTLDDAVARWTEAGAVVTGKGYAAIGAGSGIDGFSGQAAERVLLIDIESTDLEGPRPARFSFFDGVLYAIHVVLKPVVSGNRSNAQQLTEPELLAFEQRLRDKYGRPDQSLRDMVAGKKPNVFIWNIGNNALMFTTLTLQGHTVSFNNPALLKKANAYIDQAA